MGDPFRRPAFGPSVPRVGISAVRPASDSGGAALAADRLRREMALDERSLRDGHGKTRGGWVTRRARQLESGERVAGVDGRGPEAVARGLRNAHYDGAGRLISGSEIAGAKRVTVGR